MRHIILTALLLTACAGDKDTGCELDEDRDGICDDVDMCRGENESGDTDNDGICDSIDLCDGEDASGDADGDGICDDSDDDTCFGDGTSGDTDEDGICDNLDECVGDDATLDEDEDGICNGDDPCFGDNTTGDSDEDGVCDNADQCEGDDSFGDADNDGSCDDLDLCFGSDVTGDADGDGVCDDEDQCAGNDATGDTDQDDVCNDIDQCTGNDDVPDTDGDGVCEDIDACTGDDATGDVDGDGICEDIDQCTGDDNTPDADGDGICEDIDQCEGDDASGDADEDDVCDNLDECTGNDATGDSDADGVCEDIDQCTGDDSQPDTDNDGVCEDIDICTGDDAQGDSDGDGSCDDTDACIGDDTTGNIDGDAYCDDIDQCEGDDALGDLDNDGICNDNDLCVGQPNIDQDNDGICDGENDRCEGDDALGDGDGDGVCDDIDLCYGMDRLLDDDGDNICGNGTIYHVVAGIPSRFHDGLTWANAFRTPALAAEVAQAGDTVFVRSIPDGSSAYTPERVQVNPDVQWIGGFQASESHPDARPINRTTGLAIPTPHGDVRDSDPAAHWTIDNGYMDAFEFRGYRVAAVEVSGSSVLNNIIVAEQNSQGSVGASAGLAFEDGSNASLSSFRCEDRDIRYNACLTMNGGVADVNRVRYSNITSSATNHSAVINSGTLKINDMKTTGVSARLFNVRTDGVLTVTNSDLSNITNGYPTMIVSANNAEVSFTDTIMFNNKLINGVDVEGGLMDVYRTDLTLNRVHIVDTLLDAEYVQGGVIKVYNRTTSKTFDMRDSSIHGTSFNYAGNVEGGTINLDGTNAFFIGNTFGPLDSPSTDDRVAGALLYLEGVQATLTNNAMWTEHALPIETVGQLNLAWGALCAPEAAGDTGDGPTAFVELDATPFAAPVGVRLLLAPRSPCLDEGQTATADTFDIWWPGRVSEQGTTRDVAPVDLGAHYNP